jgi:hypothetical protein
LNLLLQDKKASGFLGYFPLFFPGKKNNLTRLQKGGREIGSGKNLRFN